MILYRPIGVQELALIAESGYTAFPPGTYTPTRSRGVTFCPSMVPSGVVSNQLYRFCFS